MKRTDPRHGLVPRGLTRRELLAHCGNGFAMLGLAGLLAEEAREP